MESLEHDTSENLVATVKVVGGPVLPRPQDGWTDQEANSFCSEFIHSSSVVEKCEGLPGVDVGASLENCRSDVVVSFSKMCQYWQIFTFLTEKPA